jgi:hypothetical protein
MSTTVIQHDALTSQLREQLKNAREGQVTKVSLAVIESEHKERMAKLGHNSTRRAETAS